jgi:TonB-linked SusC/RagA family outer membrane protein
MNGKFTQMMVFLLITCFTSGIYAQAIKGKISDKSGPLPGVNVLVEGTGKGAVSDMDGSYEVRGLPANTNLTVVYSFVGYRTERRPINLKPGQTLEINITMAEEISRLDEVVVVGYGVQRRRDVTGSVVKLGAKEVTDMPTPSFETAIQGKAAGVQIITGSGLAGSGSVVRIRGIASISGSGDPLYVVDGIPITQDFFIKGNAGAMNNNPLAVLNPGDIESIEILKDASATGIFGSRGANGVILITTKRGKTPDWTFNFSTRVGTSSPVARPNMLSGPEFLQMYKEAWINDGKVGVPVLPGGIKWEDAQNINTNWVDEVIRVGVKQRYDLSAGRQTKKYDFFAGISFDGNQSYLTGNNYDRSSIRLNGGYNITSKLKISANLSLIEGINNRVDEGWAGGLGAAMSTALPIYPIRNPDGSYFIGGTNPVRLRELKEWRTRELRSISGITLTYNPAKNLYINLNTNYEYMNLVEDIYEPAELLLVTDRVGDSRRFTNIINNWNTFLTATYDWKVNEKNRLNIMAGLEFQEQARGGMSYFSTVAGAPFWKARDMLDNRQDFTPEKSRFGSVFSRINFTNQEKYIVQGVIRADASSKFGPDNRVGFFPSVSGGWIVSEEAFMKYNPVINFMKVKASYGIAGVAPPGNRDLWRSSFGIDSVRGYNGQPILFPLLLENPTLKWETSQIFDAGVEMGLWEDRITTELSYYYKYSTDVFLNVSLPGYAGFDNFFDNLATIYNQGVEWIVKSKNIVKQEFTWTTEFNVARNWNKITDISGFNEEAVSGGTNDTRVVLGYPVGTNFLVRFSHVDPATGRPVYLDINGEPTFEWNPANRVPAGRVLPDAIGGVTNILRYKNYDLSFLFVFTIGGNIYDSSSKRQLGTFDSDGWNHRTDQFDRWRKPGDVATYPRLTTTPETYGTGTPWINTTLWLHDASYARLRNLTIGYTLPQEAARKLKVRNARIYFTGTNLLTFTRFIGLDPEIARDFENVTDRNMSVNITFLTPPQEKTFNLGIDISF